MDNQFVNEIGQTIFKQLRTGNLSVRNMSCWGFRTPKICVYNDMAALTFMVSGMDFQGRIYICYNEGSDLYDVYFMNRKKVENIIEGVYFDTLNEVIDRNVENKTGRYDK